MELVELWELGTSERKHDEHQPRVPRLAKVKGCVNRRPWIHSSLRSVSTGFERLSAFPKSLGPCLGDGRNGFHYTWEILF